MKALRLLQLVSVAFLGAGSLAGEPASPQENTLLDYGTLDKESCRQGLSHQTDPSALSPTHFPYATIV
jgi:hypothetical protein